MADFLEQENLLLKEEIATMRAKMDEMAAAQAQVDELTELVRTLKAAQNQPPPPPPPSSTQAKASSSTIFGGTTPFSTPQQTTPEGRLWGTPICLAEMFRHTTCRPLMPTFQPTSRVPPPGPTHHQSGPPLPTVQHTIFVPPPATTQTQAIVTYSAPRVHTTPQDEEPIFHSGNMRLMTE